MCPIEGNIHQVDIVDGPAAFIDILAPPYRTDIPNVGKRYCRYFKEVNVSGNIKLVVVPDPKDYWSDTATYMGPPLKSFSESKS